MKTELWEQGIRRNEQLSEDRPGRAWAWGNDGTFGSNLSEETLRPIFDIAMENGLNLWDTAYAYGMGTSEKVLAGFLKGLPRDAFFMNV